MDVCVMEYVGESGRVGCIRSRVSVGACGEGEGFFLGGGSWTDVGDLGGECAR